MTPPLILAAFLVRFFVRRILHRGALRIPLVRWTLLVTALGAVAALFLFGVATLRQLVGDPQHVGALLRIAGAATPMWVLAIFTVVRILFMKSGDLVELTYTFPLTNRARTLGFMIFEALLVGAGLVLILGALVSGALSIGGAAVLGEILTCLLMPAVVAYLLASAYYLALERLLLRVRLARLRSFLVPVVLAATLVASYFAVTAQSERVLFTAVGQDDYVAVQLVFAYLADAHGIVVSALAWVGVVAVLILLVLAVTPRTFEPTRRFSKAPRLFGSGEFGAYIAAQIRPIENMTVFGLVLAGSYALLLADVALPPFLLIGVTVQSVYAFVATEPLRAIGPRRRHPATNLLLLIGSQVVALVLLAVPTGAMSAVLGISIVEILAVVGFCVSNILILTLAGIAFPPEKGNPFSVLIGVITTGMATGALLLGANVLGLPGWVSIVSLIILSVAAAALSIVGMQKRERAERHEMGVQDSGKRGRGDRGHGGSGTGDRDLADVLGRRD